MKCVEFSFLVVHIHPRNTSLPQINNIIDYLPFYMLLNQMKLNPKQQTNYFSNLNWKSNLSISLLACFLLSTSLILRFNSAIHSIAIIFLFLVPWLDSNFIISSSWNFKWSSLSSLNSPPHHPSPSTPISLFHIHH